MLSKTGKNVSCDGSPLGPDVYYKNIFLSLSTLRQLLPDLLPDN